jgi:hypothetical protein
MLKPCGTDTDAQAESCLTSAREFLAKYGAIPKLFFERGGTEVGNESKESCDMRGSPDVFQSSVALG